MVLNPISSSSRLRPSSRLRLAIWMVVLGTVGCLLISFLVTSARLHSTHERMVAAVMTDGGHIEFRWSGSDWLLNFSSDNLRDLYQHGPEPEEGTTWDFVRSMLPTDVLFANWMHVSSSGITDSRRLPEFCEALSEVESLLVSDISFGDENLGEVAKFSKLRSLDVSHTNLQGRGLSELSKCPLLRELYLSNTRIDDATADEVASISSLEVLHMAETGISNKMLERIALLPNLRYLDISGTRTTDDGLAALVGMPHIQTIDVVRTKVSDRGTRGFVRLRPDVSVLVSFD